jgi:hypothetical protein
MSQQPPTRQLDRRSPIRKATATRPSSSGPEDRIASQRDIAIYFREDCRPLDDSLQLEMVAAQYCLRLRDVVSRDGVPVSEKAVPGVVAELEGHGDPLSHAILRALAHVGTGHIASRSAEAAGRLGEREIGLPLHFADVANARTIGAWRDTRGAFDGEYSLFIDFEHPLGRRHSIAIFVEPRKGGVVKHLGLMSAISDFDPGDSIHPSRLESLDSAAAGVLLRDVLDRTYGRSLAGVDDFRVLIAAARARLE